MWRSSLARRSCAIANDTAAVRTLLWPMRLIAVFSSDDRAAAAIQRGRVREREHARGEPGIGADDARDLFVGNVLVGQHFADAHGDIRERRQLHLALRDFLRQLADERKCAGAAGGHVASSAAVRLSIVIALLSAARGNSCMKVAGAIGPANCVRIFELRSVMVSACGRPAQPFAACPGPSATSCSI